MKMKKQEGYLVGGRDRNLGLGVFVFATFLFEAASKMATFVPKMSEFLDQIINSKSSEENGK